MTYPNAAAARARVTVAGCGHVGVVTAACFAALGHHVTGVDIDAGRIARLASGDSPFLEPDLPKLLRDGLASGRLRFTTSYEEALADTEFIMLCVSTPPAPNGAADLRHLARAVERAATVLRGSDTQPVFVTKSTIPIGTGDALQTTLARVFPEPARRPAVAANPEFLREGSAVRDFLHPDRIVIGAETPEVAARVAALYDGIDAPLIRTDRRTAEMVKNVANAFLATRVSFVNEIARLCERLDVDLETMLRGVTLDPRVGTAFFRPGIGYGGSCLPKDVAALLHTGEAAGVPLGVVGAVQRANTAQQVHAVDAIAGALGGLAGRTVAVWGLTFKGGVDDLRDSPALGVVARLRDAGAHVRAYDPACPPGASLPNAGLLCPSALDAARGADAVAVLTDWPEFRTVALAAVRAVMRGNLLWDGRLMLDRAAVEAAGLEYAGIGRGRPLPRWHGPRRGHEANEQGDQAGVIISLSAEPSA